MKDIIFLIIIKVFFVSTYLNSEEFVMVTAATGAFGQAISEQLAYEGHNLLITGRNPSKIKSLQEILRVKYQKVKIRTVIIDFSNVQDIERAVIAIPDFSLSGIVLIGPRPHLPKDRIPSAEEWSTTFAETFIAPLEVIRVFSPHIQEGGSIVIISGSTSCHYSPSYPNTNVIRIAWTGEIKNLTHFFGKRKIRVNAISPGMILTDHHQKRIKEKAIKNHISYEEQISRGAKGIPLNSFGKTKDVSHLVSFLLSKKSTHLNGCNIPLDGGESRAY